jgi:hypothetical protein
MDARPALHVAVVACVDARLDTLAALSIRVVRSNRPGPAGS